VTEETRTVVDRIRRTVKPETVIAVTPDGTKVPLGLGQLKTRWARLANLLDGMEWARLECHDAQGNLTATIPADDDVDAAAALTDDPVASQLTVWSAHTVKMVELARGCSKDVLDALVVALQNQVTRNAELELQNQSLQAQLNDTFQNMRDLMLEHAADGGGPLSPKENALVGAIDIAGQKFGGMPAGWCFPGVKRPDQLPPPAGNGGKQ
jgi:hypothetical protein